MSRIQRRQNRDQVAAAQRLAYDARQKKTLKQDITSRLSNIPPSWVERYKNKLEERSINSNANINVINSLDNLKERKRLLPPALEYVHRRGRAGQNASPPEHRASVCKNMRNHSRDYVGRTCSNKNVVCANPRATGYGLPTSIKRYSPKNVNAYTVNGQTKCLSKSLLKHLYQHDYTVANAYQTDASGDNWPELIATGVQGHGAPDNFRIPYHVLEECGEKFNVPPAGRRRKAP